MPVDCYHSFDQLLAGAREGEDFRIVTQSRPSPVLVLAPHGGSIEPGTSELAEAVAGAEFSLYLFEGIRRIANDALHVTSTAFDEPRCLAMLAQAHAVLAVHGCEDNEGVVWLGGRDTVLAETLGRVLAHQGIPARPDNTRQHGGNRPGNLCNRGAARRGCQIELSANLRRALFGDVRNSRGREMKTELFARLVAALREGLRAAAGNHHGPA